MSRIDVRCNVDLSVSVISGDNRERDVEKKARFTSLSLSGGFVDCTPPPKKKIVGLVYDLPRHGEFEIFGEILRKEKGGFATRFYNLNRDARFKLWDYLKENLSADINCPYCGKEHTRKTRVCDKCGWSLDFNSPEYIVKHEKESFIKRLAMKSEFFTIEYMYKILNFIDMEVFKIGKSFEIIDDVVGSSEAMLDVLSMIRKAAYTDMPVLITGESGAGKELTAMAIHERSQRKNKAFVPVNCAAIPDNFLEAEMFGYAKNAFTGDFNSKIGKLEFADGGTIFLEEIAKLSPKLQSKLLRFLEDKIVERIGADGGKKVDVRLIAATNTDLKTAIAKGAFKKELFYRLDVFNIKLPPVRERGEDKIILARYYLNKFSREMGLNRTFSPEAVNAIKSYDWPDNVREIINKIRRSVVMSTDSTIPLSDLDLKIPTANMNTILSLREVRSTLEKQKLIEALGKCNNNISKVARALGISRPSVYSLKKKYGIK